MPVETSPRDIPTSGGVTDTSQDTPDGADQNSIGGAGVGTEGMGDGLVATAGDGPGGAGATAKACTLIPTNSTLTAAVGLNLWWLILATALLGALRAVKVSSRRRR